MSLRETLKDGRTIAVAASHDGTDSNGHDEARGHAPDEEADHGAGEAGEDDGFAAELVGRSPPSYGCEALGNREDGSGKAGPFCDFCVLDAKAGYHLGEVGKD